MEKQSHCCGSNVVMKKVMQRRRAVMVFMQRAALSNDGGDGIFSYDTSSLDLGRGCDGS